MTGRPCLSSDCMRGSRCVRGCVRAVRRTFVIGPQGQPVIVGTTRHCQVPGPHRRLRSASYPRCSRNAALAGRSSEGAAGRRGLICRRSGGHCERRCHWTRTGSTFSPNADSPCSCLRDRHMIALRGDNQGCQCEWTGVKGHVSLAINLRVWCGDIAGRRLPRNMWAL